MDPLNSYANMQEFAGQRQWTSTERRILKRLVLNKYNVVTKDVSLETKDIAWIRLTQEFNKTVFGSFMMTRTVMELRLQWEKITEDAYKNQSRHLLNSYYRARCARARNAVRDEMQNADSDVTVQADGDSDEQHNHRAKRRRTSARNESGERNKSSRPTTEGEVIDLTMESEDENTDYRLVDPRMAFGVEKGSFKDGNGNHVTRKPECTVINDADAQEARVAFELAEVDDRFWKNKFERIESQCKNN